VHTIHSQWSEKTRSQCRSGLVPHDVDFIWVLDMETRFGKIGIVNVCTCWNSDPDSMKLRRAFLQVAADT
jgi:hypothetical protein